MEKIQNFNVKWILKTENLQLSHHLNLLKIRNIHIKKVSMHFISNSLFHDVFLKILF